MSLTSFTSSVCPKAVPSKSSSMSISSNSSFLGSMVYWDFTPETTMVVLIMMVKQNGFMKDFEGKILKILKRSNKTKVVEILIEDNICYGLLTTSKGIERIIITIRL